MSARIKVALVAALSVMTASCAHLESLAGPALRPGALAGTWEGTGIQSPADENPSWPMRLVLDAGGDGVVSYPSLNCSGTLTRVGPGRGGVVYREVITQGVETCISGGPSISSRKLVPMSAMYSRLAALAASICAGRGASARMTGAAPALT